MFTLSEALRGAATLKARALKEVWNIAAVIDLYYAANDVDLSLRRRYYNF